MYFMCTPFQGFNITLGNDVMFNAGCTILDVCPGMLPYPPPPLLPTPLRQY